jgi:DNA-binding transcriptional ArsR family regulator
MSDEQDQDLELTSALVPFFVITNGRALPPEQEYERTALVTARQDASAATRTLSPEARAIMDLIADGFLSVAEVAGHTRLPLGIVRILLAQLEESGLVLVRQPVPRADPVDRELIGAVLDGLKARFGA